MKKISLKLTLTFMFLAILTNETVYSQLGALRVRGASAAINIGYQNYRYLSFGQETSVNKDGPFAIEYSSDGGLNFWKPWPVSNSGNYNLYISDLRKVSVNMKNDNLYSTNYAITNNFQVRGYVQSHGYWQWSDSTLKRDILKLDDGLAKLLQLKPIKYYYKENNSITGVATTAEDEVKNNTIQQDLNNINPVNSSPSALRFGFNAQDLETIFPNLVSNDAQQKSVNYVELVPVLVNAIREQQTLIEGLKQEITDLKGKTVYTDVDKTKLFQNDPNPFRGITNFSYFIDENVTVSSAVIEIRSIMGVLQNSITLGDRSGLGKILFDSNGLADGYYIYTLKINGSVKDSKMMLIGE
jgi:hypothetical protein